MFVRIRGVLHYLWRALDQHGIVLDILVQKRRNGAAASVSASIYCMGCCTNRDASPRMAWTAMASLSSDPADVGHRTSSYLNNRADNSHRPTR